MVRVNSFDFIYSVFQNFSGKFFMGDLLQINIFRIKVCIYVICVLFVKKYEESIQYLFFECSNTLHIWS